jgi:hypothetical protein
MTDPATRVLTDHDVTECNLMTISDEASGISVSVPILPDTSILSSAGRTALRIAEAFLKSKIAESNND